MVPHKPDTCEWFLGSGPGIAVVPGEIRDQNLAQIPSRFFKVIIELKSWETFFGMYLFGGC
jgi:hypothetical protein